MASKKNELTSANAAKGIELINLGQVETQAPYVLPVAAPVGSTTDSHGAFVSQYTVFGVDSGTTSSCNYDDGDLW